MAATPEAPAKEGEEEPAAAAEAAPVAPAAPDASAASATPAAPPAPDAPAPPAAKAASQALVELGTENSDEYQKVRCEWILFVAACGGIALVDREDAPHSSRRHQFPTTPVPTEDSKPWHRSPIHPTALRAHARTRAHMRAYTR